MMKTSYFVIIIADAYLISWLPYCYIITKSIYIGRLGNMNCILSKAELKGDIKMWSELITWCASMCHMSIFIGMTSEHHEKN